MSSRDWSMRIKGQKIDIEKREQRERSRICVMGQRKLLHQPNKLGTNLRWCHFYGGECKGYDSTCWPEYLCLSTIQIFSNVSLTLPLLYVCEIHFDLTQYSKAVSSTSRVGTALAIIWISWGLRSPLANSWRIL